MRTAASCVPLLLVVLAGSPPGGVAAASPAVNDLAGATGPGGACDGGD